MSWMSVADFEARYRDDPDPWGYVHSGYEHDKYAATLTACGEGPFACALELGSSIGVFSAMLAPRCSRLVTIDAAATAVASARARLASESAQQTRKRGAKRLTVELILGRIPSAVPAEIYDLVVASEILYYLAPAELEQTLALLPARMAPGARLVTVHWRPAGPERPFDAEAIHSRLRALPQLQPLHSGGTDDYLLDVLVRK